MAISPATVAPTPPSLRLLVRPCKEEPPAFTTRRRSIRKRVCLRTMGQTLGPGADVLADVAAEDLVADGRAQFRCDLASFLNGEVSDAAARIHFSRRDEGLSGAGIQAARATSAAVGGRKIGREFQRGEHHA